MNTGWRRTLVRVSSGIGGGTRGEEGGEYSATCSHGYAT